ncbi:MAG: TonB-dependent receptor [Bacteroidales bacterium]|nr:TonB-dependent receptor [Bacteroidales bacterium]
MVRKCFARIALVAISMTMGVNILCSQESRNYQLEELVVSSSRVPIDLNRSARVVTVLDSIAIKVSPAHTVNDLLKYAIGVDVRQRGGMGIQTDISMRGGTSDQIAILINGINVCDPQTGHFALDLPMDKSDIERIEVLEGPAGRIYGTSSLVGAINIITKKPVKSSADVRLEGGSHGSFSGTARGAIANGKYSNSISFGYGRSDGYLRNSEGGLNSDFDAFKVFYQGRYDGSDADISWLAGLSDKAFGANTFYSVKYDDQYEHTSKAYFAVQAETKGRIHFKPSVYWMHSRDRFELLRGDESKVPFNYHRTNVYGLNLGSYFNWELGKTAFGAEMRNEDVLSTTLGDSLNAPKHIQGTDREYSLGKNRTNISLYLEHNVLLRRLTFSGGVTAVKNTGSEMSFRLYPGADMSVRIGENWKAYASWNTSLRMPTFTELYYSVGGHKADKYLKPEEMTAYEAGLKYSRSWLSAQACVYMHRGRNMIDWIRDSSLGDEAVWTSVNHTRINAVGEEISFMVDMPSLLGRNFFLKSLYLGWSHIDQDKNAGENIQSQYSLEYLRNKVVAKADMNISGAVDVNLSWRWQQRAGNYVPYSVFDARIGWRQFFVNIENLLNHEYSDFGGVPQPKLWVSAGVTVSLYPHFPL